MADNDGGNLERQSWMQSPSSYLKASHLIPILSKRGGSHRHAWYSDLIEWSGSSCKRSLEEADNTVGNSVCQN